MYKLKRGKRPELLKREFSINQWNEYEKFLNNKKMIVRKRSIEVWNIYEDDFWGRRLHKGEITKEDLIEFEIFDLIEQI